MRGSKQLAMQSPRLRLGELQEKKLRFASPPRTARGYLEGRRSTANFLPRSVHGETPRLVQTDSKRNKHCQSSVIDLSVRLSDALAKVPHDNPTKDRCDQIFDVFDLAIKESGVMEPLMLRIRELLHDAIYSQVKLPSYAVTNVVGGDSDAWTRPRGVTYYEEAVHLRRQMKSVEEAAQIVHQDKETLIARVQSAEDESGFISGQLSTELEACNRQNVELQRQIRNFRTETRVLKSELEDSNRKCESFDRMDAENAYLKNQNRLHERDILELRESLDNVMRELSASLNHTSKLQSELHNSVTKDVHDRIVADFSRTSVLCRKLEDALEVCEKEKESFKQESRVFSSRFKVLEDSQRSLTPRPYWDNRLSVIVDGVSSARGTRAIVNILFAEIDVLRIEIAKLRKELLREKERDQEKEKMAETSESEKEKEKEMGKERKHRKGDPLLEPVLVPQALTGEYPAWMTLENAAGVRVQLKWMQLDDCLKLTDQLWKQRSEKSPTARPSPSAFSQFLTSFFVTTSRLRDFRCESGPFGLAASFLFHCRRLSVESPELAIMADIVQGSAPENAWWESTKPLKQLFKYCMKLSQDRGASLHGKGKVERRLLLAACSSVFPHKEESDLVKLKVATECFGSLSVIPLRLSLLEERNKFRETLIGQGYCEVREYWCDVAAALRQKAVPDPTGTVSLAAAKEALLQVDPGCKGKVLRKYMLAGFGSNASECSVVEFMRGFRETPLTISRKRTRRSAGPLLQVQEAFIEAL